MARQRQLGELHPELSGRQILCLRTFRCRDSLRAVITTPDGSTAAIGRTTPGIIRPANTMFTDIPLPGFTAGSDYDAGWLDSGNWANYTRNYPAGKYYVYGHSAAGIHCGQ